MTSILVADDHAIVRAGIRLLLGSQPDLTVAAEAEDGEECVTKAMELRPDIVLMDIAMPRSDGIAATRRLKQSLPGTRVLGLTMYEDDRYFFRMLQAGADGYVLKGADPQQLLAAIRAVAQGQVYIYPSLARKLLDDYLTRTTSGPPPVELTEREKEVLRLIALGLTGTQISEKLFLSIHTIDRHRSNIMAKLDLHNRAALIKYAIRKGLVDA